MNYRLNKNSNILKGFITLPASKSISNRILIIRALCDSCFPIKNLSESEDTQVLKAILNSGSNILDAGHAGAAMRFLTAFASTVVGQWIITGSERMKQRPIGELVEALRNMGALIEYTEKEGFPPLKITGTKLRGTEIEIDGSISSQFISALLMIAPAITGGLTLKIKGRIVSMPYIEMTLKLMEFFGVKLRWQDDTINIREQNYTCREFTVESDWSAASYWYEMAALSGEVDITLLGLKKNSYQGDSILPDIFYELGVKTVSVKNGVRLSRKEITAKSFEMDCSGYPDLIQTLAVTCALLKIPFHIKGAKTLRIKETDRIHALKNELAKIGVSLKVKNSDELIWDGKAKKVQPGIKIETYSDHRMAMAFAPAAIKHPGLMICDTGVVGKSYPHFWEHLKSVGFYLNNNLQN
ncbi:MAG: 3-phosphoshikimate 1-carboxyvinyltransferase [Bacteroidetes bacterium]|nr:3-phosphoshikimate 1-carboxyvinyltransferase [Bacteroidota bacterium]